MEKQTATRFSEDCPCQVNETNALFPSFRPSGALLPNCEPEDWTQTQPESFGHAEVILLHNVLY